MKKFLSINQNSNSVDIAILILRVGIASLMLTHGLPKLESLLSGNIKFPGMFGLSPALSLGLTVFAEVICSFLILFGIATRFAVIPLIITMAVAVFYVHASDPFGKKEAGLLYMLPYVALLFTGSGKYSVDYLLQRPKERARIHSLA